MRKIIIEELNRMKKEGEKYVSIGYLYTRLLKRGIHVSKETIRSVFKKLAESGKLTEVSLGIYKLGDFHEESDEMDF